MKLAAGVLSEGLNWRRKKILGVAPTFARIPSADRLGRLTVVGFHQLGNLKFEKFKVGKI